MRKPVTFAITLYILTSLGTVYLTRNLPRKITDNQASNPVVAGVSQVTSYYGFALDSLKIYKAVVNANETLSQILSRYNVSEAVVAQLSNIPKDVFDVRTIRTDNGYAVLSSLDSLEQAKGFVYFANPIDYVVLKLGDTLTAYKGKHEVDTVRRYITGSISSSLYASVVSSGATPELASELEEVFAFDVDFFGLQPEDNYRILYNTFEVEGQDIGKCQILAANMVHGGKKFYIFGYDQQQGKGIEYFDAEGNARKGKFLKAPLKFSRISSKFSHSRFHPVLKRHRAHHGVDYAAPKGTPVHAIGDGVVISAGYSGGAGHMVKIKHDETYTSAYLHLSKYGSGVHKGARVSQGQTIGFVGSTGLSTGPHLDFRIWKNGVPVNPLKVTSPSSGPVMPERKADYLKHKDKLLQILEEDSEIVAMQ